MIELLLLVGRYVYVSQVFSGFRYILRVVCLKVTLSSGVETLSNAKYLIEDGTFFYLIEAEDSVCFEPENFLM